MSASLVGSEMCIRDRAKLAAFLNENAFEELHGLISTDSSAAEAVAAVKEGHVAFTKVAIAAK
eukprot:13659951-Alexandrium_andersonii.AAC.1